MISVRQAFDLALQHFQRGKWQQAEQMCLQILEVDSEQVDALQMLAAIAGQTGRDGRAIDYLQAVLRLKPRLAAAHNNLGNVFIIQRKLPEAVASFQEAVRLQPDFAVAHNNLGNALREQGRLAEAAASFQQALRIKPDYAEAHFNLGLALHAQGKSADGQASLLQTVSLRPDFAEAYYSLGIAYEEQGKLEEAVASFRQTVRLKPDFAEAHVNLGNALVQQRNLPEAVGSFEQALRLRPDFAEAHNNLGNLLRELGQLVQAEASLQQALRIKPDYVEAHYNLGIVLWKQRRLEEAAASYQQALRLKPDYAEANLNIGIVRKDQGRLDDAIAAFRTALQIKPEAAHIHSNIVLTLNYHPRYDARAIQEECSLWNQQHADPLNKFILPHTNRPDPERRLRIGYVSPDFREHVDSFFTIPLLSNQDLRQFEIFCYADVAQPDALTERLRGYADVWRSTVGFSDQQLADMIRSDRIDILIDLKLHTANNRLLMFARKPAPVQVTWLGYPGTTGLSAIDYRLTDPYLDPLGLFDAFYAEESVRLPDTYWCYDPLTDQPPVNALPALQNGYITFGCLNSFSKVNDGLLSLWGQVLQAVPGSRLLLLAPRGQAREHVLATLEQAGVASARLEFADKRPRPEYLKLYHRIDCGLDPMPYNGHTTSLDAFWMGVSIITLVSKKTSFGRAGWSQLCNLGLKELAAETPEQYVALAAELAADLPRLQELRSTLRQRMLQSPLMDGKRFAHNVEHAYRQMWRQWCRQTKSAGAGSAISRDQPLAEQRKETVPIAVRQALEGAWQYYQKGQWQQAEQNYLQVLEADSDQVDALQMLAAIAGQTGRDAQAIDYLQAVLRLQPGSAAAHNNLGNVFIIQRKLPEAVASFQEAVRLQPDFAAAHNNLGNALREQGRLAEAAASLQQALRLKPGYAEAHFNLGLVLHAQGKLVDAQACLHQAVRLRPDYAEAHFQLGFILGKQGRHEEAVASNRQALRLKPDYAEAHFNLGAAFVIQGKLDEAVASYQQAVRIKPKYVEAHHLLGHVLRDQGRLDDAIAAFRTAIQLQPDEPRFLSSTIMVMNLHPDFDMEALYEECRRWNQQHAAPLKNSILPHTNLSDLNRRLRVGYVSADFREHVDAHFTVPLLSNHDHRQFEIYCYANVARPDTLTERLRGQADMWRNTVGLSDQQVADLVRSDQIDILIDLKMHTANNRLLMFARKPAPVQVAWLAYPGTTGLSAIDYRLTDPHLDSPGLFDAFYAEESWRLPETFWCYDPLTEQPPVNALPATANGVITFGCLNNFSKVNDGLLSLWARVFQAVPQSRMLLHAPRELARAHVLAKLQQEGITASRVEFVEKLSRQEYLKLYHRIDIALDPLPYNGGTTTLDALWMGVPIITLVSKKTTFGRAGWSQLCNLGLKELAAETPEQYVALAVELAADLPRLQELRGTLRQRMLASPLMDGKRFALHVEHAYRQMWHRWCQDRRRHEPG
jgi:protein O-GlcNAc transferase